MAIYDTNNHICQQFVDFSFLIVLCIAIQRIGTDETLFGVIFFSGLEAGLHEVRNISGIIFNNPLMAESILRVGEVLLRVSDVLIELRSEVVHGVLSDVVPFSSGLFGSHDDLVVVHSFGNADGVLGSDHIGIRTERRNEVIEIVTKRGLLMGVLSASGGGADGVGVEINLGLEGSCGGRLFLMGRNVSWCIFNNPLVAKSVLSISEIFMRIDDMAVELGVKVIEGILSNVVILGSSLSGSKVELMSVHSLGNGKGVSRSNHVGISSVIDNGVIDGISERSLLVSVLGATSRAANRIGLDLHSACEQ